MPPRSIAPLLAILISVFAFGVSVWQGWETRQHDRLSVRPLLTFDHVHGSDERDTGILLHNRGVGPAIIRRFQVFLDGKPLTGPEGTEDGPWANVKKLPELVHWGVKTWYFDPPAPVSVGDSFVLFGLSDKTRSPEAEAAFAKVEQRVAIRVFYCSVYDECEEVTDGSL